MRTRSVSEVARPESSNVWGVLGGRWRTMIAIRLNRDLRRFCSTRYTIREEGG
jgi:hypothetical protein